MQSAIGSRFAVVGAGAWGTALASVLVRPSRSVTLWAREPAVVEALNERHENETFLPGVTVSAEIAATGDLELAVAGADVVLLVSPAQHLRSVAARMRQYLTDDVPVVLCTKGVEQGTGALMSEVLAETLHKSRLAVLSGPTFAREVARGLPAAVTIASTDAALASALVSAIGTPRFRPYASDDPVGAQIGGAVKNVMAIGCGIIHGRELGENARAALITRGLAEMVRLGRAKGAHGETLMGLSGLGDLSLTCNGLQSRNMSLGADLGRGRTLAEILEERQSVAEGVATTAAVQRLAADLGVEMPIVAAVHAVLFENATVDDAIENLLSRPFRTEASEP